MLQFSGNEIDTTEAAKRAGCSRYRITTAINDGELFATNVGYGSKKPRWAIDPDDLKEWLDRSNRFYKRFEKEEPVKVIDKDPEPTVKEKPRAYVINPHQEKYEKLMAKHQAMLKRLEELENELLELAEEIEDIINE